MSKPLEIKAIAAALSKRPVAIERNAANGSRKVKLSDTIGEEIRRLKACGWSNARIAAVLDMQRQRLENYYRRELDQGADIEQRYYLGLLADLAKTGHFGAIKKMLERIEQGSAVDRLMRPPETPAAPAPPKPLGKKELAREQALRAGEGSEWGEDLAPIPVLKRLN